MSKRLLTIGALLSAAALAVPPVIAAPASQPAPVMSSGVEAEVGAAKAAMMADPAVALKHARAVVRLSKASSSTSERMAGELTGRWLEGEALVRINRPADAKPIIEEALASAARSLPNTKLHADLLKARAGIALITGEVSLALSNLLEAHDIFRKIREPRSQAIVLQNIGAIYFDARDYQRALSYYDQADEAFGGDPALAISSHNNRANALKELGKIAEAEAEFGKALVIAREMKSPLLEARILTNIASAQVLNGKLDQADRNARAGLRLSSNSAEGWEPFLWGVRAQVALARGDLPAARTYIERTFRGTNPAETTILFRDFHDTARRIYSRLGAYDLAFAHMAAFKRVDDEARDVAASTSAALMTARFDATNQKLRIAKLKAGQLQRDVQLARSQDRMDRLMLISIVGAIAALIVFCAIFAAFVTARKSRNKVSAANVKLTYAARHDALTGLANRSYMRELIVESLRSSTVLGDPCALMLIDLDRFKMINDTLGHGAGDALLLEIAERLSNVLPAGSTAGRLGGDEFAAIVRGNRDREALAAIARNVVAALQAPFSMAGTNAAVGASVGISIAPDDGMTVDVLTRNADLALYQSKNSGGGKHTFYEGWMLAEANERMQLEEDLRVALEQNQLTLVYQPIVDAGKGQLVAYEALLRWHHPTRGDVTPAEFIPIAEEAGIIRQIGEWVLRTACIEAARWPEHVKVAINLSAVQVEAEGLVTAVLNALAASGLAAERLEFEVTESVFLRQGPRTGETLERLRALGVSLALDDFGTGYSSLGYLQRAEFSKIKIDRSFVKSAAAGCEESLAIIQAIVALAKSLGMQTTAEGVETEIERTLVCQLGCSELQGYLVGLPKPIAEEQRETHKRVA